MLVPVLELIEKGFYVTIITAAGDFWFFFGWLISSGEENLIYYFFQNERLGYPNNPKKYEERIRGLLDEMNNRKYTADLLKRFYLMGGECNYLHRINSNYELECVGDEEDWKVDILKKWPPSEIAPYFDKIANCILQICQTLKIVHKVQLIRKEKAIGNEFSPGFFHSNWSVGFQDWLPNLRWNWPEKF